MNTLFDKEPPNDFLSGYYVTLRFDISSVHAFPSTTEFAEGDRCYAVIERGEGGLWKPVSLARELPANLPENRVALLGRINYGRIEYGIETFYIPESKT